MKRVLLLCAVMATSLLLYAQERKISGTIVDNDTKEEMVQTSVQLLKKDSTFVGGAISDDVGKFTLTAPENGQYIVRLTSVGYKDVTRNVAITDDKDIDLGTIVMVSDAIMLKGVTATGHAAKVVLKEDTFQYNASAYRVPEGSAVEELVKKIPGAEVTEDGKITVNGRTVDKIKVGGKEFMTGDTQTALKNLPASIVDNIKAYDEKSDLARVTGIDDGNEQMVLDFGIKPGMNKGFMSNIDLAIGTKHRYAERLMGGYFNDKYRFMLFGNANNTNDIGFPGGGGRGRFGGNRNGLNTSKMIGANFNYDDSKHLKLDASLRWNHRNGDIWSRSATENFVSTVGSFSNSISQNYTRSNSWNGNMRVEWTPDSMTNIMFRPSFSFSTSDGNRVERTASYKEDPYLYVLDPLSPEDIEKLAEDDLMVNSQNTMNLSYGKSNSANAMLQFNRKLNRNGRNLTLRTDWSFGNNDNTSLSTNDVHLYMIKTALGLDSTYQTNRYSVTPTRNWSYALQFTYSEPIAKAMFLQFSYKYQYRFNKSDRSTYDFSEMGRAFFDGITPEYRNWNAYLSRVAGPISDYLDTDLSRYSEYRNYIHEAQLMYRWIQPKFQLNAGIMIQPQKSKYMQDYQGIHVDTTRTVTNWSPTVEFRYRFSRVSNLRINYRGTSSQPSMTDLLDITDDSDPLNVTKGNPGLKPSFTNNFRLFYNNYIQSHQRAIMTFINYSNTRNSISSKVTYDERTGGRTTQPENINGNWNTMAAFMFNTAIDSAGYWNVNTFTNFNYNHYVGYLSLDRMSDSQKNTTRTMTIGERLSLSYRNSWIEIEPNASVNYTHARNKLQSQSDLDTWEFSYGLNVNLMAPWGMTVSTGLNNNSRRGYSDKSMNTNELIWNAQLSQSFLKGKPLSVTLQFYDILHNQSNLSRMINERLRRDTEYNSINSYAMLHLIYRFNAFGGRDARGGNGGGYQRGPGGTRGGFGGRPGGFGGGRPGGF